MRILSKLRGTLFALRLWQEGRMVDNTNIWIATLDDGVYEFICKPLDLDYLFLVVDQIASRLKVQ